MIIVNQEQVDEVRSIIGEENAEGCERGLLVGSEMRIYFNVEEIMSSNLNDQGKSYFRAELRRNNGRFALGFQAPLALSHGDH